MTPATLTPIDHDVLAAVARACGMTATYASTALVRARLGCWMREAALEMRLEGLRRAGLVAKNGVGWRLT